MISDLIVVIGAYGSGKSEYAINLAEQYNNEGNDVSLVDMDVVNPYFRSRDVRDYFAEKGIDVICPEGENAYADLPMMSPRIAGIIAQNDKTVVLDVGGDPSGCRVLARFTEAIKKRGYQMHFVVNTMRPFTGTKNDIISMLDKLERAAKLKITELVSNANLLEETDEYTVTKGIDLLSQVSFTRNIRFEKYLVLDKMDKKISDGLAGKKKQILHYYLQKPWEKLHMKGL